MDGGFPHEFSQFYHGFEYEFYVFQEKKLEKCQTVNIVTLSHVPRLSEHFSQDIYHLF